MTVSATNESINQEKPGLRGLTAAQQKSGLAAWLGSGLFGRLGDRLGRCRAISRAMARPGRGTLLERLRPPGERAVLPAGQPVQAQGN
jgi:hypothetical protein